MNAILGFEITNLPALQSEYRLLAIEGLAPGDDFDKQVNLVLLNVTRELRQPVALVRDQNLPCLAIPAAAPNPTMTWPLTPHVAELRALDGIHSLDFARLDRRSLPIASRFLAWALDQPFYRARELWNDRSTYFHKDPIKETEQAQVFQGVRSRVIAVEEAGSLPRLVWVADVCYRYTDALWLPERLDANRKMLDDVKMSHCLYHFGERWFRAQIFNDAGRSIQEQKFVSPNTNQPVDVYAYTKEQCRNDRRPWIANLNPESRALVYRYPGKPDDRHGAAALCKLILKTNDPAVQRLHAGAIMPPHERLNTIQGIQQKYLSQAKMGDVPIEFAAQPFEVKRRIHPIPDLVYGDGKELNWRNNGEGQIETKDLGRARMEMLSACPGGCFVQTAFQQQYLLVPRSFPKAVERDFRERFGQTISNFHGDAYSLKTVVYDDSGANLQTQVAAIQKALKGAKLRGGYVLLILPERADARLHDHIKRTLWPNFQFQCALASNIRKFYVEPGKARNNASDARAEIVAGQQGRLNSYLRYLALGMLIVNRKWPFMPAKPFNYDVYVGVDVLNQTAGLTFLSGYARECHFHHFPSQQAEKLTKRQMEKEFYEQLPLLDRIGEARSLVITRDGRSFVSERKGVAKAIERLKAEGKLRPDLQVGTVEIHKTSATPLRLFELENRQVINPRMGTAFAPNERESFLCTTGWPFDSKGTSHPLQIKIIEGDLELSRVEADIFAQACLAWTAPDRPLRLPIPIKICDLFLRPVAGELADENDDDEDDD